MADPRGYGRTACNFVRRRVMATVISRRPGPEPMRMYMRDNTGDWVHCRAGRHEYDCFVTRAGLFGHTRDTRLFRHTEFRLGGVLVRRRIFGGCLVL